jgi:hypothetical protein
MKEKPNKALKLAAKLYEKWFRDKETKERRDKIQKIQDKITFQRDYFIPVYPTLLEKRKEKLKKIQDGIRNKRLGG